MMYNRITVSCHGSQRIEAATSLSDSVVSFQGIAEPVSVPQIGKSFVGWTTWGLALGIFMVPSAFYFSHINT